MNISLDSQMSKYTIQNDYNKAMFQPLQYSEMLQ